ncbi:MAG: Transcriptional regulator [Comamonadaceae bacterium]|nr:MAG: Transcriptional regulator [Comamonadaceae bacterium]
MDTSATDQISSETSSNNAPAGAQASVQVQALLRLRELILAGELPGGARIAELAIVETRFINPISCSAAVLTLALCK